MKLTLNKVKEAREAKLLERYGVTPIGKWAVFKRSSQSKSARFAVLHDTREKAEAEAKRLALDCHIKPNRPDPVYYVVFVESEHTVV